MNFYRLNNSFSIASRTIVCYNYSDIYSRGKTDPVFPLREKKGIEKLKKVLRKLKEKTFNNGLCLN